MNDDYKDVSGLLEEDVSKVSTDEKASVADKIDIGDKIEIVKPIIPIKPIRAPKFAAMRTMAEYSIPTPVTRKEMYLNVIAGGVSALPTPITREEIYLAKICGMDVAIPIPLTRYEMYLYKLAGGEWEVPTPVTRLEMFLYHNCGYEIEVPEPITREEIYWFGGQPVPEVLEGVPPLTFTAKRAGTLIDYRIDGNTVQNGTPTPDNPIEPEFVGDKTENLFDVTGQMDDGHYYNDSGNIASYSKVAYFYDYMKIDPTKNLYIYNAHDGINTVRYYYYNSNKEWLRRSGALVNGAPLTPPVGTEYIRLQVSTEQEYQYIMITQTSISASPFIPYGYKIPISSAGQTKNIYLGQVQSTRKIKKLVLTGEESLSQSYNRYRYYYTRHDNPASVSNAAISNILLEGSGLSTSDTFNITNDGILDFGVVNTFSSLELFRSYLAAQYAAGTPVTIWYVLATPEVGIVNEPLAKIGDYADSVDFSQAGVEIPVTAGENTLSVGTNIQPSNMMISYK